MLYDFRRDDGAEAILEFSPDDVPSIGEEVIVGGVKYTRLPSLVGLAGTKNEEFASYSAPSKSNAKLWGMPEAKEYHPDGRAIFRTRREARDYAKSCEKEDGKVVYDG